MEGEAAGGKASEGKGSGGGARGAAELASGNAFDAVVDREAGNGADADGAAATFPTGAALAIDAEADRVVPEVLAFGCFGAVGAGAAPFLLKKVPKVFCSLLNSG